MLKIRLDHILGNVLALTMAYQLWGWKGVLFTFGLILSNG